MYAKLMLFQELVLATCFSPSEQFLHFVILHVFCRFWNGEKTQRNGKKKRNKSRAQNVETETAKRMETGKFRQPAIIIAVSDFER